VRGDVLSIRLVAPAGDFLARLSLPFFAAVPIGTPIVNGGVQTPIPSAGPYYLRLSWQNELIVLERNPNYHGARPHRLERIVYNVNDSTRRTISLIEKNEADYSADVLQLSPFALHGPLDSRFGRPRSGTPRLVQTPQLAFRFLQLNTARGPFVDARLRRAVNYAIDRRALAAADGSVPSDAYLPPGLPSAGGARVYPLSPELAQARKLAHGFRGTVVLYTCRAPHCTTTARIVRANLAPLRISVKVVQFEDPFTAAQRPGAAYDILVNGWAYDWPDPYDVLNVFLDPNGFRPDWAPPAMRIPSRYRQALERAAVLRGPAREATYRRLSVRLAREVAPFAVYSTPVLPEFFSARVGCRVEQPVVGAVDIGALCVKG
jgi:ABC-type transport system substrate-binding protein